MTTTARRLADRTPSVHDFTGVNLEMRFEAQRHRARQRSYISDSLERTACRPCGLQDDFCHPLERALRIRGQQVTDIRQCMW